MKYPLPTLVTAATDFKAAHRHSLAEQRACTDLDQRMQQLHDEVFAEVKCLQCANCCRTTGPLFTQQDIERIAAHLAQPVGHFIREYLQMDEDGDFVLQTTPCAFLSTDDNTCSIYAIRPDACRDYPHTHRANQQSIFDLTLKNAEVCPAVLEILDRLVS